MKLLKELGIWLLILYPSVALFSTTTAYYQSMPSNKLVAAFFDPHLILSDWKNVGNLLVFLALLVGMFVVLFTWYLLAKFFKGRPYKTAKILLTAIFFASAWSLTGNFAVIKNGYSPLYFNPLHPIRITHGCMMRKHLFWFIYEQYSWC